MEETLIPLKEWICDVCGDVITDQYDWLEWEETPLTGKAKDFRIVHHKCKRSGKDTNLNDLYIHRVVGVEGLAILLNILENSDPSKVSELTEIIRRLHFPYYEEARRFLPLAWAEGEIPRTTQITIEDCKRVISEYSKYVE